MAISIGILTLGSVILLMAAYRNPVLYAQCLSMTWCFSQTCRWPDSLLFDTGPASATWCFSSVYLFNLYFRAIDIIYNCVVMTSLCVWTSLPSFIKKKQFFRWRQLVSNATGRSPFSLSPTWFLSFLSPVNTAFLTSFWLSPNIWWFLRLENLDIFYLEPQVVTWPGEFQSNYQEHASDLSDETLIQPTMFDQRNWLWRPCLLCQSPKLHRHLQPKVKKVINKSSTEHLFRSAEDCSTECIWQQTGLGLDYQV